MQPSIPFNISAIFIALTFLLFILIMYGINAALKKKNIAPASRHKTISIVAFAIGVWLLFLKIISSNHILDQWQLMPPRLMIVVLPPLIVALVLTSSKKIGEFLKTVPHEWMVFIQSFRIVMEAILWMLFVQNIIPEQMTFEGRNFDILAGVSAVLVGYLFLQKKISNKMLIAWNIFGLVLLLNIVIVAILSTPIPFRVFMNEPANTELRIFHLCGCRVLWYR